MKGDEPCVSGEIPGLWIMKGCERACSMHQLVEKLSHTERAAVAELKALLVQQYGVRDIRLFGSKARGTGHIESDLDLFIVVPDLDWERAKAIYTLCFELS